MSDPRLDALRDLIQQDVNQRGLRTDPVHNLIKACPDDFRATRRELGTGARRRSPSSPASTSLPPRLPAVRPMARSVRLVPGPRPGAARRSRRPAHG